MKRSLCAFGMFSIAALVLSHTQAKATNLYPPGGAILDLSGLPLPTVYTEYSVSFVASSISTDVTIALRNDPGWFVMDDVSVVDTTNATPNLLVNGDFDQNAGSRLPWLTTNIYGATNNGSVDGTGNCDNNTNLGPRSGQYEWCDGSTGAYDAIHQKITTVTGDSYLITLWLDQVKTNPVVESVFKDISDNGGTGVLGNGIDVLVYAEDGLPPVSTGTPEPASIALVGAALVGFVVLRRRVA